MNDKDYETQKRRIRAIVKRYRPIGLDWWHLEFAYARHPSDMPEVASPLVTSGRWEATASTNVAWQYRDARITFNVEAAQETDDEDLELRFLHEYAHCLVNEMRSISTDEGLIQNWIEHEEHVCTGIAYALYWAYRAGSESR